MRKIIHWISDLLVLSFLVCDVFAQTRLMSPVAGNGKRGFSGDGGPATSAEINQPTHVIVDDPGNLYIVDTNNHRLRKVNISNGVITTLAGTGLFEFTSPANYASLNFPTSATFDTAGNIYVGDMLDSGIGRIHKVTPSGSISLLELPDTLLGPLWIAADTSGNLFVAEEGAQRIRKIVLSSLQMSTVAGTGSKPMHIALDSAGNIYFADPSNNRIRKVSGGTVTTVADGLNNPRGVALDDSGNIYIADTGNKRILKKDAQSGAVTLIARSTGTGDSCTTAASVTLDAPASVVVNPSNTQLYVADVSGNRVWKVDLNVVIPQPTLAAITPASGVAGSTVSATLTGTGFALPGTPGAACASTGTQVSIGGSGVTLSSVSVASTTSITATLAISADALPGPRDITATTVGGTSNPVQFNVTPLVVVSPPPPPPRPTPTFIYDLPPILNPTDQAPVKVGLVNTMPEAVTGKLTLKFIPNAVVPADDPHVMFINAQKSTRTVDVSIPARSSTADLSLPSGVLQAGTVAGTIELTIDDVHVADVAVTPSGNEFDVQVPRLPPVITSVRIVNRSSKEFSVEVTGYSTSREISAATFQFGAASGAKLLTLELNPEVISPFTTYYQSPSSTAVGGSFLYLQPFKVQRGNSKDVASVTVTLANSAGASESKMAQ